MFVNSIKKSTPPPENFKLSTVNHTLSKIESFSMSALHLADFYFVSSVHNEKERTK